MKRLSTKSPYSINALCRLFGVSKQAYYQYADDYFARLAREELVIQYAQDIRKDAPGIGGEKLWLMYNAEAGVTGQLGRDAFLHILRANNLLLRKSEKTCRTTDSTHGLPTYPDLIKNLLVTRPAQVYVSDITYVRTMAGFVFLSLVTDAYTRQIVGWCLGRDLTTEYPLKAIQMATEKLKTSDLKLIHHSDRGSQYASMLYTTYLRDMDIKISMTESGDPKDNAVAERVNGILKTEFLYYHTLENYDQALEKVTEAIEFYNSRRPHRSLDMRTPNQVALMKGEQKKRWKGSKDQYRIPEI